MSALRPVYRRTLLLGMLLGLATGARAATNIAADAPYAWAENAGWITLRGNCQDGVVVSGTSLSGYAWSENLGWINLGDGTNLDPGAFGIINDAGNLSGFAWGENFGWINFDTSATSGARVTIDGSGLFQGYAWSENLGWITFASGYGVEVQAEGEGQTECPAPPSGIYGTVDADGDFIISLSELLRVIQFYNSGGLHCAQPPSATEDGYVPGPGGDQTCAPYVDDYNPQDWAISLSELLRVIQFYNAGGYHYCPSSGTEDGYCSGPV